MGLSTAKQRQDLGFIRKLLGIEEDVYREMLGDYEAQSSKELSSVQINELINRLRYLAIKAGVFKPTKAYGFQKYKYDNLGHRSSMATPAQLRKIEAMWYKISRQTNDGDRAKALGAMIKKIVNRDDIKFMTSGDVRKMIKVLETMKGQGQ